jgi:hypothetical protein
LGGEIVLEESADCLGDGTCRPLIADDEDAGVLRRNEPCRRPVVPGVVQELEVFAIARDEGPARLGGGEKLQIVFGAFGMIASMDDGVPLALRRAAAATCTSSSR